jgi:ATPase subunit of ABC transporter with duplicated ATPase domains
MNPSRCASPILQIDALGFAYPDQPAIASNWTASVGPGVTLLYGDTGAGKTALLRHEHEATHHHLHPDRRGAPAGDLAFLPVVRAFAAPGRHQRRPPATSRWPPASWASSPNS